MALKVVEDLWQLNKNVCQRNEHMLSQELATDVTFRVSASVQGEVETIRAHAYMLISASPVFWAMFCGDMRAERDVKVRDVEPEAFRQMLRYIYTDQIQLACDNIMNVIHAAKKYKIQSLAQRCIQYLENELKTSNACSFLDRSRFLNEKALGKRCLDEIERNTVEAFSSEEFLTVSNETLSMILESDLIGAMDEVKIFEKCYQWAAKRVDTKTSIRDNLGKNIFKIRFPVMPMQDFKDVVCQTNVLSRTEQLEIMNYMASPTYNAKPRGFKCEKRKKADPGYRVGDKVRVTMSRLVPSSEGVIPIAQSDVLTVREATEKYLFVITLYGARFQLLKDKFIKI